MNLILHIHVMLCVRCVKAAVAAPWQMMVMSRKWRFWKWGWGVEDGSESRSMWSEGVLGFVGAGSEGPQGGRWGMVKNRVSWAPHPFPILLNHYTMSYSVICPQRQTVNGAVAWELCLRSALGAVGWNRAGHSCTRLFFLIRLRLSLVFSCLGVSIFTCMSACFYRC